MYVGGFAHAVQGRRPDGEKACHGGRRDDRAAVLREQDVALPGVDAVASASHGLERLLHIGRDHVPSLLFAAASHEPELLHAMLRELPFVHCLLAPSDEVEETLQGWTTKIPM